MISKKIIFVLITACVSLLGSCASLRAGFYLSSIDSNSGTEVLRNEPKVRIYLENILYHPEKYIMNIYSRRSIAVKIPKTKLLHH
ncbi:MAG: hypothetical protein LBN21_09160, partial [Treponema sp.]|nr:hypothetical protein [Treponema sp.]